jgi:hypothetical protein
MDQYLDLDNLNCRSDFNILHVLLLPTVMYGVNIHIHGPCVGAGALLDATVPLIGFGGGGTGMSAVVGVDGLPFITGTTAGMLGFGGATFSKMSSLDFATSAGGSVIWDPSCDPSASSTATTSGVAASSIVIILSSTTTISSVCGASITPPRVLACAMRSRIRS